MPRQVNDQRALFFWRPDVLRVPQFCDHHRLRLSYKNFSCRNVHLYGHHCWYVVHLLGTPIAKSHHELQRRHRLRPLAAAPHESCSAGFLTTMRYSLLFLLFSSQYLSLIILATDKDNHSSFALVATAIIHRQPLLVLFTAATSTAVVYCSLPFTLSNHPCGQ